MSVLFVADLHYALKQFDWLLTQAAAHEAIAIGGDLLDLSSPLDFDVQIMVIERYLNRLRARTRVLVSSGNHDGDSRNDADESVAAWLQDLRSDGLSVDFDHVDLDGNLITICPWWDGPVSRARMDELLARGAALPRKHWTWIHHAPPDRSPVCWNGRAFAGDSYLGELIGRHQPDLVLSGHIHNAPFYAEGSWVDRIGSTWVMNPGRQIGPQPAFVVIDYSVMSASWLSLEGADGRSLSAAGDA